MRIQKPPAVDCPEISLRQLERSDIPAWYAYLSQREVIQYTSWDLKTENELSPLFDELDSTRPSSNRRLAITQGADRELIGTIGFHTVSDMNRSAEIA